jgi:SAM-dependent methyltransferase
MAETFIKDAAANYRDSSKLKVRANLHVKYGRSPISWFQWIAQQAALPEGAAVLDVGCGPGWLWAEPAADFPAGLNVTLADLSPGMVDEAVAKVGGLGRYAAVTGLVADAQTLPFADASFDAVLACHMLYHVPDEAKALDEMARVLRPGGIIAVTTNGHDNMIEMYELGGTAFGGAMSDPSGVHFGLDHAVAALEQRFVWVEGLLYPSEMVITDGEDIVATLTSYPPGETASAAQVGHLRRLVAERMAAGGGVLAVTREQGMVRGRKAG